MTKTSRPGGRARTPAGQLARKSAILDAIVALLMEGGIGAVTTDAIASRADVSKATIYRLWPTKSLFLIAALEQVIRPVRISDLGSFEKEIRAFLEERYQQLSQPGVSRLLAAAVGASAEDPVLAASFHEWVSLQMSANIAIIRRGIERGEVAPDVSVDSVATMIGAPLLYRTIWERQDPSMELVDTLVRSIVTGLRPVAISP